VVSFNFAGISYVNWMQDFNMLSSSLCFTWIVYWLLNDSNLNFSSLRFLLCMSIVRQLMFLERRCVSIYMFLDILEYIIRIKIEFFTGIGNGRGVLTPGLKWALFPGHILGLEICAKSDYLARYGIYSIKNTCCMRVGASGNGQTTVRHLCDGSGTGQGWTYDMRMCWSMDAKINFRYWHTVADRGFEEDRG
jgi:hypothetical protein